MPTDPTPTSAGSGCLAELFRSYTGEAVRASDMVPVAEGASGRCIMRCTLPRCRGIIGIYWTAQRADNNSFLPAADMLQRAGVPVPRILARRALGGGCGACLTEDLGETSLLSMRNAPAEELAACYRAALESIGKLHGATVDRPLQPPFDASLYREEQAYFAEHLPEIHPGHRVQAAAFCESRACRDVADWLAGLPRRPVHRDYQSQNIIMRDGKAYIIDFQGMRMGQPEYDLASLLYDPYTDLSRGMRDELLAYAGTLPGAAPIRPHVLEACAMQRLMQALGAFAAIGRRRGKEWYLGLIPVGLRILRQICDDVTNDSPAAPLAACIRSALS